jgi:hypothetical protein
LIDWASWVFGFSLGIVIGLCLGVVAVVMAEGRDGGND